MFNKTFHANRIKGSSLVELCVGLLLVIPLFLFSFDGVMLALSMQYNEKVCREATRTAAAGDPEHAELRAQSVVKAANEDKAGIVREVRLLSVNTELDSKELTNIKKYGGPLTGKVVVHTEIEVRPNFFRWLMSPKQVLSFKTSAEYPYTYIVPAPKVLIDPSEEQRKIEDQKKAKAEIDEHMRRGESN